MKAHHYGTGVHLDCPLHVRDYNGIYLRGLWSLVSDCLGLWWFELHSLTNLNLWPASTNGKQRHGRTYLSYRFCHALLKIADRSRKIHVEMAFFKICLCCQVLMALVWYRKGLRLRLHAFLHRCGSKYSSKPCCATKLLESTCNHVHTICGIMKNSSTDKAEVLRSALALRYGAESDGHVQV